jgi:carboxypeptidase C (cathepsin A)
MHRFDATRRNRKMRPWILLSLLSLLSVIAPVHAADAPDASDSDKPAGDDKAKQADKHEPKHFKAGQTASHGSVTVGGQRIDYNAYVGTLVVHSKGWDDVPQNAPPDEDKNPRPEASMFYVAYFKSPGDKADKKAAGKDDANAVTDVSLPTRPITFIYNGGPGSATVWLHMGAWGPRRVVTADDTHTPAAPYNAVNNACSLLDVSDLVFIDAPGAGFSRIAGKDREKAFYGVDPDAHAFADFIVQFLTRYGRWNSPKYLFGESYGTTRSAALISVLTTEKYIDFNGVILLSQILNFDNSIDQPELNPGMDLPYELALPSMAAAAWYHHKLPDQPAELQALLPEVETFAMHDYAQALARGSLLSSEERNATAAKLHDYTGLPVEYILRADLRVNGPEFEKTLQQDSDTTTGRLDARFSGPTIDPLGKEADYDPMQAAFSSAYVSVFNDYVRRDLRYSGDEQYQLFADVKNWDLKHDVPGGQPGQQQALANVMPDLALAMKYNPEMHVMLNGGYFDLGTPFYAAMYEMQHLTIPASLQKNIEYSFYNSGHMVYAHEDALKQMHAKVADFIRRTSVAH